MTLLNKTLLLLYHQRMTVKEGDLCRWIEQKDAAVFRRNVLRKAHDQKLLEYDSTARTIEISPLGVDRVETNLLGSAVLI
jgi:hypothetical protein